MKFEVELSDMYVSEARRKLWTTIVRFERDNAV